MNLGSVYYHNDYFSPDTQSVHGPDDVEGKDLLVFWGGGDINPALYGERNVASGYGSYMRDSVEVEVMLEAFKRKIPIVGICRGAQLGCVMTGGKLYQDVNNHGSTHGMAIADPFHRFGDSPIISTSSVHHQMMIPAKGCEIIAKAPGISSRRVRFSAKASNQKETEEGQHDDPEVLFNPDKRILMIQGHPEFTPVTSSLTRFTVNLINHFFGLKL